MANKFLNIVSAKAIRNKRVNLFLAKHWLWLHLHLFYYNWQRRWANFKHPYNLNEWLLALSYKNSRDKRMSHLIPLCADKVAVRDYVAQKGFAHTLVESFGAYGKVEDIPWDVLPKQFVMKMNNASGRNRIYVDGLPENDGEAFSEFREWLHDREFGLTTGEWQYSLIEPRILIEKYLQNLGEISLIDYKFNCIHGKPFSCFVGYNRNPDYPHGDVCFDDYDLSWNRTERIKSDWHKNRKLIPKPKCWNEMVKMAEVLSADFEYVRVDMYEVDGAIVFGELTFTPQGCVQEFYTDEALKEMLLVAQGR